MSDALILATFPTAFLAGVVILYTILYTQRYLETRRMRRNIRQWLPLAIKNGPRSVEWEFIAQWIRAGY